MENNEKFLVTGAPGWLCNSLVKVMCEKKLNVRCLVLKGINTKYLEKLGVEMIFGNVLDYDSLLPATAGIDKVIHAVGIIHPKKAKTFYQINTQGTKNMLEASSKNHVKKFLYISSNSAQGYNTDKNMPMTENGPDHPYTDYGKSKWEAEQIVKEFQRNKKLQTVILRPCWFYGPNPGPIMIELINHIKNGRPPIFGDGTNLRTMSYIDNTVEAILLAINNDKTNGNTYWIGDERPYRLVDVYNEFAKQLNVKIKPWKIPWSVCQLAEKFDIFLGKIGQYHKHLHVCGETGHNIWCDTKKAKDDFGYKPKISLSDGVKKTIESARKLGLIDER